MHALGMLCKPHFLIFNAAYIGIELRDTRTAFIDMMATTKDIEIQDSRPLMLMM